MTPLHRCGRVGRVDYEERLAARGDERLLTEVVLDAAVDVQWLLQEQHLQASAAAAPEAPVADIKLFNKWNCNDVVVNDLSLKDYIAVMPKVWSQLQ